MNRIFKKTTIERLIKELVQRNEQLLVAAYGKDFRALDDKKEPVCRQARG